MNHLRLYHESFQEDIRLPNYLWSHHRALSQWGEVYPSNHADCTGEGPTSMLRQKQSWQMITPLISEEYSFAEL